MTKFYKDPAEPLVSVVALCFNQVDTAIETLQSVFNQNYSNIELIICDDASSDGSQGRIDDWINQHKSRFVNVHFIQNTENLGICQNMSNGISTTTGVWIKPIACDDLLISTALSDFVSNAKISNANLIFSQMEMFTEVAGHKEFQGEFLKNQYKLDKISDPVALYYEISYQNFFPAPSSFFSKEIYLAAGGIDLRFRNLDDWPLWVNLLENGATVSWIPDVQVHYRISLRSISQARRKRAISDFLYSDLRLFFRLYQSKRLSLWPRWEKKINDFRMRVVYECFGNTYISYLLTSVFHIFSPEAWKKIYRKIQGILSRD